jgi:hypothetical protein
MMQLSTPFELESLPLRKPVRMPACAGLVRLVQSHGIKNPKYHTLLVIPAKAGIQSWSDNPWTPACAGVTEQLIGHFIE